MILAIVGFFRERRKYKADDKTELKERIDAVQSALNTALEEGMITDAKRLQEELRELWDRYRRTVTTAAVAVAASLACTGCLSAKKDTTQYVVVGERINIVEPGQQLVVPPLVPPAKKWYLVDNVGLAGWLGLPTRVDAGSR